MKYAEQHDQDTNIVSGILFLGMVFYYFIFLYKIYYIALVLMLVCMFTLTASGSDEIGVTYLLPLGIWYVYLCLTATWSPDEMDAATKLFTQVVLFLFAFFPVISRRLSVDAKPRILQAASLAFVCTAFASKLTTGTYIDLSKDSIRTLYAAIFLTSAPSHVYLILKRKSKLSTVILLAIVFLVFQIGSRTLLLFFLPLMLASVIAVRRRQAPSFRRQQIVWGLLIILMPIAIGALSEINWDRVYYPLTHETSLHMSKKILKEVRDPNSNDLGPDIERRIMTFVEFGMFVEHPLTGAGYESTSYYVHKVSPFKTVAHGLPLMLLSETGAIGTLLFSVILWYAVRGYWAKLRVSFDDEKIRLRIELITLVAIMLVGLSHQIYNDIYLYIYLGTGLWYFDKKKSYSNFAGRDASRALAK